MPEGEASRRRDLIFIFALGLLFRLVLLLIFPVPYGNDSAGRFFFRDQIWLAHWLPATQVLVYCSYAVSHSVVIVRLVFAVVGSLAGVAFTFYLQTFARRRTALIGGMLFTTNSLLVFLSLMPYQETVFLGLLFGSLAFFIRDETRGRSSLAAFALYGLACLTRYEAWFILPALLWRIIRRAVAAPNPLMAREAAINLLGLGWGPAVWMLANWQQWGSPTAFLFFRADHALYAWAPHAEIMRIVSYTGWMLYWIGRFGSPLVVLALPGLCLVWKNRKTLLAVLWPALLLCGLELIFLIFIAGREFATANRFASMPLSVTLIFVAFGAEAAMTRVQSAMPSWQQKLVQPKFKLIVAGLFTAFLLIYGAVPIAQAGRLPEFRVPYEIVKFLEAHLPANERVLIVAESLDGAVPMPYQRIAGQLDLARDRLLCAAFIDSNSLGEVEAFVRERSLRYLVVFGGEWPRRGSDEIFLQLAANPQQKKKIVFSSNAAIVYELKP